jgi:transglutaminase superfamily protein
VSAVTPMRVVRRMVPLLLLPLALMACALASAPWLRAFPSALLGVPLFGAALLSVLAPVIVFGIGVRRLWLSAVVDLALFVFYELLVTVRQPGGFDALWNGLVHGPSQILTYALPLVSPRTLLVAPVALCWLSGAILGECLARAWQTVVPYLTLVVVFGLAYGASARAVANSADGRHYDTILAVVLLLTMLLLRATQAWVAQDDAAEATDSYGVLPLRGLAVGVGLSVAVAVIAASVVQAGSFNGPARRAERTPPIDQGKPLTPLSFIADQRPDNPKAKGRPLFSMTTNRSGSNYVPIASVDYYDGEGWSFNRTFRPTGGVIPADEDPALRSPTAPVTQQYTIDAGALTSTPWMPALYRPAKITGLSVDVDTGSGMVVPSRGLRAGDTYSVRSDVAVTPFSSLRPGAVPAGYSPVTLQLPIGSVKAALATLVNSLTSETQTVSSLGVAFLQAVTKDFRDNYALTGGPPPRASASRSASGSASVSAAPSSSASPKSSASPSASASTSGTVQRAGGTSFADVLASIRQFRSATPEQYATLTALIARQVGIPARVVTGYRIAPPKGSTTLPAGRYQVTTAQAWTWVEVPISGQGWVVLDPSPGTYAGQRPQPTTGASPSKTPTASPTQNAQITPANTAGHAPAPPSSVPHRRTLTTSVLLLVLVLVGVFLLTVLAFVLLRKRWRAGRRRRVADPRRRLLGAWQESLDLLEEAGLPDLTYRTSREVAAVTRERFGNEAAARATTLGTAANVAIFRPSLPVSDADAYDAWVAQAALADAVRHRLTRRERITARLRYQHARRGNPATGPRSWADRAAERPANRTAIANRRTKSSAPRRDRSRTRT